MNIEVKRDGIILRGKLDQPEASEGEKYPAIILFHGFTGDLGYDEDGLFSKISRIAISKKIAVFRFDFNGHGKSDGDFSDMDVLREILDAIEILKYVQKQTFVSDIYVLGHSQGGVVGGILAGLYPDVVKKLVLLAPAATLKSDAIKGTCMGTEYDTEHTPDVVTVSGVHPVGGHYFRIAKNLPIYEVTEKYTGPALLVHGTGDDCVDYHASVEYDNRLGSSTLKLYDSLDHGICGQDQQQVLEEIEKFL